MARVIEDLTTTPTRRKYPWDEWLDGQARELVENEDFSMNPDVFRTYLYSVAREHSKKITTRVVRSDDGPDVIQFQVTGEAEAQNGNNGTGKKTK